MIKKKKLLFLKKKRKFEPLRINEIPKVGVVNGLWANDLGIGGLIPIECCWIPAKEKLDLELALATNADWQMLCVKCHIAIPNGVGPYCEKHRG